MIKATTNDADDVTQFHVLDGPTTISEDERS
jgi:hypothetical protein